MKRSLLILFVLILGFAFGQLPKREEGVRLPSGKLQSDEILKADHEKNLKDAAELLRMTEDLNIELEKKDPNVLSVAAVKKTEEIEKLAKRIRSRMKRF
jgi:ATP-dependent helicase/DNAse subunit B